MNSKDFFGGLAVGAGIGLAAGIILAPEKGNETLKKLTDVLKDRFKEYKGQVEDASGKIKRKGENMLNEGQEFAEDHMQDGEQNLNELKNKFNNSHS